MNAVHVETRPVVRAAARRLPESGLLLLTSICSVDGTMAMLAASGALSTWTGAVVAGLTVIAGAGAWLAARREFAGRALTREDAALLALLVLVGTLAAAVAAAVGARLAASGAAFRILPSAAGVALLLLALEVGGAPLPRVAGKVPLAAAVVVAALALEGVLRWIP